MNICMRDVVFSDGSTISILCNVIEDTMDLTTIQYGEFDRLVYGYPLEFAELVLSGELERYLKGHTKDYKSQEDNIRKQLIDKDYSLSQADEITCEFMRYDS